MFEALASDSSTGVRAVWEGEREKGEKLSPKVRTRGMLEVGQERQQEVPRRRRDTAGQGCEGRLPALQASEVYFSQVKPEVNTGRKACGSTDTRGDKCLQRVRQASLIGKGKQCRTVRAPFETGTGSLEDRNYQSCPLALLLLESNPKR